jgi:signal transduction histidine kinase
MSVAPQFMSPAPRRPARLWQTTAFRAIAVATVVLAGAAILVVAMVTRSTNDAMSRATVAALDHEGATLRLVHAQGGLDALVRRIGERIGIDANYSYRLTDGSGKRIAGNLREDPAFAADSRGGGTFRYRPEPDDVRADTAAGETTDGDGERLAAARVFALTDRLTLIVARDIEQQRFFLARTNQSLGIGVALLTLLGLGAGIVLARHILGRVDTMTAASRSIMAGNLTERLPRTGASDEFDRLADSVNAMLDRIELLMAGMKEVSDNIAHDLKTPLNRLRNRAEAALADTRGGPAWRAGLENTIEDADELMKTFNALLLIARLEAGAVDDTLAPLDLGAMVEDLADLYAPAAEDAGISLTWQRETAGAVEIRANRQLIGQAIANLIENAFKYAAPAAPTAPSEGDAVDVTVTLRASGGQAEVAIADRGPGIAEADRDRAMRRFVRLEASRTKPGTGLGLSLVAAVARLHGGELRLEDNRPGLRAVLSLPMMASGVAIADASDAGPPVKDERACRTTRAR